MKNREKAEAVVEILTKNGRDAEVLKNPIFKAGKSLTAITLGCGTVRPTVYIENFGKMSVMEIASKLMTYMDSFVPPKFSKEELDMHFESVRKKLIVCYSDKEQGKEIYTFTPDAPLNSLKGYFRIVLGDDGNAVASIRVTKDMFANWSMERGVILSDVLAIALENANKEHVVIMGDKKGCSITVSNKNRVNGINVLSDGAFLERVREEYFNGDNLLLLPVSEDEVLIARRNKTNEIVLPGIKNDDDMDIPFSIYEFSDNGLTVFA